MSHKLRKLVLLSVVFSLVALSPGIFAGTVSADPVAGCYVNAPTTVNEDAPFTVTIQCDDVLVTNNVFGFQFGTTLAGDYDTSVAPSAYSAGTFADLSTGATSGVIAPTNALPGLYVVSRKSNEVVSVEDFTLATFDLVAEDDLTVDGSVVITMTDADFMLSNNLGEELLGWLRDVNDLTVTINNLDLAWLSGNMEVRSDVTAITNMDSIEFIVGDKTYSASNVATYTNTFAMDDTYQYTEAGSPDADGTLSVSASADIFGHLACTNATVDLGDAGVATLVSTLLGTGGTITLKAGDADNDDAIDIDDATLIGANIGTGGTLEEDVNGDGAINILDLVHVGRNYSSTIGTCGTGS
jgi:hypothetical protein